MISDRTLLTLVVFALCVGIFLLMAKGWRGRKRRQADLPPPPVPPADPGQVLVGAVPGLFVGTTYPTDWLDRVAVHGLASPSAAWTSLTTEGVLIEREGAPTLYLPYDDVDDVELGDALAGKMIGKEGLLILTWRLGGTTLLSGFRADDHAQNRRLMDAVRTHLPVRQNPEENP